MRSIELILERMEGFGSQAALFWKEKECSYEAFIGLIKAWEKTIEDYKIKQGTVCAILSDYTPKTCALFFALMKHNMVLVPFTRAIMAEIPTFKEIAGVQCMFTFDEDDNWEYETYENVEQNQLVQNFREQNRSGLIVFSSGSTGRPKGILQDCEKVMDKFITLRDGWRTVLFLMMDHFGGFNTLLSTFAYGGMGVCLPDRTAENVCIAIQQSQATLLPTTPTFLNLLIASGCHRTYNLDSVKLITYGTEMMNETTLKRVKMLFPKATLKQTYGLSELGVLRSKSESDDSTWMKIGGNEFKLKIVDNILWIKADSNMIGYLNADNPFDEEGWFCTGDEVEVKGEYMRFLGRKTEMINVGGQKVYPAEVEAVLLQDPNVKEAVVYGKKHPLMGQVVVSRVTLHEDEDINELSQRLRKLCSDNLTRYKIPVKFSIVHEDEQHNERFKKIRLINDEK